LVCSRVSWNSLSFRSSKRAPVRLIEPAREGGSISTRADLAIAASRVSVVVPVAAPPGRVPLVAVVVVAVPSAAVVVTTLWIVGMINSINFIDGLDGLSSGVAIIAALTLGVISVTGSFNQPEITLLCAILAGSLLGFLPRNFHPAHIFIGTTGVYLVGFALAVLSILGTAKVAVALLVLGVPIIDTFWIIVRRLAAGQSPFTADRGRGVRVDGPPVRNRPSGRPPPGLWGRPGANPRNQRALFAPSPLLLHGRA